MLLLLRDTPSKKPDKSENILPKNGSITASPFMTHGPIGARNEYVTEDDWVVGEIR